MIDTIQQLVTSHQVLIFVCVNVLISGFVALILASQLSESRRVSGLGAVILFWILGCVIPLGGLLLSGFIFYHLCADSRTGHIEELQTLPLAPDRGTKLLEPDDPTSKFNLGMSTPTVNILARRLLMVSSMATPEATRLLRASMTSRHEEIRLLAFSLIEQRQQVLTKQIDQYQTALTKTMPANIRGVVLKELVTLLHEQCRLNLGAQRDKVPLLTTILDYTQEALKHLPNDSRLWLLLAVFHNQLGQIQAASDAMQKTAQFKLTGPDTHKILAHIYFNERRWPSVSKQLSATDGIVGDRVMTMLADFWQFNNGLEFNDRTLSTSR